MPAAEPMPKPTPFRNQVVSISRPKENHIKTSKTTEKGSLKPKERRKIILLIIRDEPGISHAGICQIMRRFCKHSGYKDNYLDYSYYLNQLIKEEKIIKVRLMDTWRYIPYVRQ